MMNYLLNVFRRELRRMASRRIYWVTSLVLPLFSLVFMATIFGNGQMQNLPIGVVDTENTSASRNIIRMADATPTLRITHQYANETEAKKAVKKKEVYGYLLIEEGTLCYYYHNAMLSVGGEIHSTLESLLKQVSVTPLVTEAIGLGEEEADIVSRKYLTYHSLSEDAVINKNSGINGSYVVACKIED